MRFQDQLSTDQAHIEEKLDQALPRQNALDDAMRHAVLGGGKRLRAHLVYETARICGLDEANADHGAIAIELMHAYSLVHDDLPSMDNDDLRRGAPTVHKKWNEYTAILAGDALQTRAFEALAQSPLPESRRLELIQTFAQAAGHQGMARGQFFDLEHERSPSPMGLDALQSLQRDKTGALISWSAQFGARAAGRNPAPFAQYAKHLGLAFQIWDDILDVEASSQDLGKTAGKDEAAGKVTYVSLLGLDQAKADAQAEIHAAQKSISQISGTQNLSELAEFVINRGY